MSDNPWSCEDSESSYPYGDPVYTSTGCEMWADSDGDSVADAWVDNCLVCSQCDRVYDFGWYDMLCCDAMFWNSNYWWDPTDDTSPRLTCEQISVLDLPFDCTGCACPGDTSPQLRSWTRQNSSERRFPRDQRPPGHQYGLPVCGLAQSRCRRRS